MKKKLRVGVIFGGRSGEHEVSLLSAASVLRQLTGPATRWCPSALPSRDAGLVSSDAERLLAGTFRDGTLRAGDPQHTAPAALLAKGEGVIVPPVPAAGLPAVPWCPSKDRPLRSRQPTTYCSSMSSFRCCMGPLAKMAPCRALRARGAGVCRLRGSGLGSRHGQRSDEAALPRRRAADHQARYVPAPGVGETAAKKTSPGSRPRSISALCEAGEPGFVGRHQQGA